MQYLHSLDVRDAIAKHPVEYSFAYSIVAKLFTWHKDNGCRSVDASRAIIVPWCFLICSENCLKHQLQVIGDSYLLR